jgi:hypothetical protein
MYIIIMHELVHSTDTSLSKVYSVGTFLHAVPYKSNYAPNLLPLVYRPS